MLLKNGEIVENNWQYYKDKSNPNNISPEASLIFGLSELLDNHGLIDQQSQDIAIAVPNDAEIAILEQYLEKIVMVILDFPKFTDGRAYSQAKSLRHNHKFKGVLRAGGDIRADQVSFMRQCGFDEFIIPNGTDIATWQKIITSFSLSYQQNYLPERGFSQAEIIKLRHA